MFFGRSRVTGCAIKLPPPRPSLAEVPSADNCVSLQVADSPAARQKGLSGRSSLLTQEGLLFVFDEPGEACMWMKGMKFSIDILWLDSQAQIKRIKKEVSPETYPESFCVDGTKYVIELAAGTADKAGLRPGLRLKL